MTYRFCVRLGKIIEPLFSWEGVITGEGVAIGVWWSTCNCCTGSRLRTVILQNFQTFSATEVIIQEIKSNALLERLHGVNKFIFSTGAVSRDSRDHNRFFTVGGYSKFTLLALISFPLTDFRNFFFPPAKTNSPLKLLVVS